MRIRLVPNAMALSGIVLLALSACGDASSAAAGPERGGESGKPEQGHAAVQAAPPVATPAPSPLPQLDRNALEMARTACANRDFKTLFTAMAVSKVVRQKYSAPMIEVSVLGGKGKILSTRKVARAAYDDYPVRQVDYYYKPAKPKVAGDEDEYLDLQFNESQSEQFAVEWARVHYDGKSEGGDDLGNIIGPDGEPLPPGTHPDADGQLLFWPTKDCWQLEADTRWRR
ncbi:MULTISPECIES: hypothetical protein [unclassified Sphingopyxis]|uniref:hypothetical protein n=1 Tax=Sphingopyxis sp. DBS4 TaxID=2968500 RepID=UPI00214B56A9|nr:hypothetical protein [Sphingopyxis sp. DBS4]